MNEFSPRRMGMPLTEEERARRHYQLYGTTTLPPRGTGLGYNTAPKKLVTWDLGTFVIGGIAGLIFGYFIFTSTGRKMGYRTGERIAGRI